MRISDWSSDVCSSDLLAVTRWREDATCDDWGSYIYLRDVESDLLWSATYQPTSARPDQYSVAFSEERATFSRQDGDLHTTLEVVVSTEDDAEVRRLTISHRSEERLVGKGLVRRGRVRG